MKKKHPDKNQESINQPVSVDFISSHPGAKLVCIAGSFNQWTPEAKNQIPHENEFWEKKMNLMPGIYEYCLIVDGQWTHDPEAKDYIPNPYGGCNSVVKVDTPQI